MALDVFLSYSRADLAHMERLREYLAGQGFTVRIDHADILPGEAWRQRLRNLIEQADSVVFLLSNNSLRSRVCAWEAEQAAECGKRIIPVVIERNIETEIPARLQELNYLFMRSAREQQDNLPRLAESLRVNHVWLRYQTALFERATAWANRGEHDDELLTGAVLTDARNHMMDLPSDAPRPPELLTRYLRASMEGETLRHEAELRAAQEREEAERRLRIAADSRRLSLEARAMARTRPDLAALLARAAWEADRNPTTRGTLTAVALMAPRVIGYAAPTALSPRQGAIHRTPAAISFSASGRYCAISCGKNQHSLHVLEAGRPPRVVAAHQIAGEMVATAVDEAGNLLFALVRDGTLYSFPLTDPGAPACAVDLDLTEGTAAEAMIRGGPGEIVLVTSRAELVRFDHASRRIFARADLPELRTAFGLRPVDGDRLMVLGYPHGEPPACNRDTSVIVDRASFRTLSVTDGNARALGSEPTLLAITDDGELVHRYLSPETEPQLVTSPGLRTMAWDIASDQSELAIAADRELDFYRNYGKGGFKQQNFYLKREVEPVHNGFVRAVEAAPDGFGARFVSLGKDGSAAFWSGRGESPLLRRMEQPRMPPAKPNGWDDFTFSPDGQRLCGYGRGGFAVWDVVTGALLESGHSGLMAAGFCDGRSFGVLDTGDVRWLPDGETALRLGPVRCARAEGAEAVVLLADGDLFHLNLAGGDVNRLVRPVLPENPKPADKPVLELDTSAGRFALRASSTEVLIGTLEGTALEPLAPSGHVDANFVRFLPGGEDFAIGGHEEAQVISLADGAIRYDYGLGGTIGTPIIPAGDAEGEFLILLEFLGARITLIDRGYRSVQAQIQQPTGGNVFALRAAPCGSLLVLPNENGSISLLPLDAESLASRLDVFAGRALTEEERASYDIGRNHAA